MSWIGVVTDAGNDLLAQWALGGRTLHISSATVGSGTHEAVNLRRATALAEHKDNAQIVSSRRVAAGQTQIRVRVGAISDGASYTAKEIGIWGHLDDETTETLLMIHQEDTGIVVPTAAEIPGFFFDLYSNLLTSGDGQIEAHISLEAYVAQTDYEAGMATKADKSDAVSNITRSGTTFTATLADGTTFTFDQQDTWRPVQNSLTSESQTDGLAAAQGKVLSGLVENAHRAVAYYVNGDYLNDTLAKDSYVYIRNHSALANGLYIAVRTVPSNTTITSADVEYVDYGRVVHPHGGGLNHLRKKLNDEIDTLNGKFKTITSGSLRDINETGIYYLTSAVTDMPDQYGGVYIVGWQSATLLAGVFVSANFEGVWQVRCASGQWSWNRLSKSTVQVSGTTTASGAIAVPTAYANRDFINALITSGGPGFVVRRDTTYFTVFSHTGVPLANTAVTFNAFFI